MSSGPCASPPPASPSVLPSLPVPRLSQAALDWLIQAPPMPLPPRLVEESAQLGLSFLHVSDGAAGAPPLHCSSYDRSALKAGIVHIGVGAFHRGHLAVFLDEWLQRQHEAEQATGGSQPDAARHAVPSAWASDWRSWGIFGVGLQAGDAAMQAALAPQDCLYSVTERSGLGPPRSSIVRCLVGFMLARDRPSEVLARMASPDTHIVSMTITEGGYYQLNGSAHQLDEAHPSLAADLAAAQLDRPQSIYGYLAAALAMRRAAGLRPFTVMSCDNMPGNGRVVRAMLLAFLQRRGDTELAAWLEQCGAFPNAMVDRICPRATAEDVRAFADCFHVADAWPVVCESFKQLVVEDAFCDGRPAWESVGVQMTSDVHPYEELKLRVLNAGHSALCYLGALAGFEFVHEVASDPSIRALLVRLMCEEVQPLLHAPPGTNVEAYIQSVLTRFANPTIRDALSRICMQGSAKLPKFLLPSVREQLQRAGPAAGDSAARCQLLSLCIASWMRYLGGVDDLGRTHVLDDVMAAELRAAAVEGLATDDPTPFLRLEQVFEPELARNEQFGAHLSRALRLLRTLGAKATVQLYLTNQLEPSMAVAQPAASTGALVWGAVELGGTSIKLAMAVGEPTNVVEQQSFPTGTDPALALERAVRFFEGKHPSALAVGSFGPVDLDATSPSYGFITSTPKSGWQQVDVLGPFRRLSVPLGFSTDVSTAAYGEFVYGRHGADVRHCAYVTVGTGIGAGLVLDGRVHTGMLHPETGHLPAQRHPRDVEKGFTGICPFHTGAGACLEGLASANACAARLGLAVDALASLPDSHEVWEIEAFYLAQLCVSLTLSVCPQVIVLGGGLVKRGEALLTRVRRCFLERLNGYLLAPRLREAAYITRSRFDADDSGTSAGCVGTLAFAKWTLDHMREKGAAPHPRG